MYKHQEDVSITKDGGLRLPCILMDDTRRSKLKQTKQKFNWIFQNVAVKCEVRLFLFFVIEIALSFYPQVGSSSISFAIKCHLRL